MLSDSVKAKLKMFLIIVAKKKKLFKKAPPYAIIAKAICSIEEEIRNEAY